MTTRLANDAVVFSNVAEKLSRYVLKKRRSSSSKTAEVMAIVVAEMYRDASCPVAATVNGGLLLGNWRDVCYVSQTREEGDDEEMLDRTTRMFFIFF
jgi:hypothetical protein